MRMERARQLLAEGRLVKEVAFALGYRHANDFSRAYKKFSGHMPRRQSP
ncbi:MAG: helix-turn-helix domain-containing protein [Verrucomicrobiae bacterium]|nr:helix-turn-helix domain-containing protein [Verrucomicrobiae bacterium]